MPGSIERETGVSLPLSSPTAALLSHLESARDLIARRLVQDHHSITSQDLNYITTSTLLQVLFLKTGQECGFIEPGTLAILAGCDGIPRRMGRACSDAGLSPETFFEKGPEASRPVPDLHDAPLREIIRRMDQPDVPVSLSRLPLDKLAAVFDHFLGTRMQVAEGYRVIRVAKSAVHYTGNVDVPPQTVVDHMASETLGGIHELSALNGGTTHRVLDPACGAGVFLLAVYRFLVRKKTKSIDRPSEMQKVLQDLVSDSVFGTDIDPESVSAARFVLLLAFIEESNRSGAGSVLPDQIRTVCTCLIKTIRCGNALIAPDYFSGKPVYPFNVDERQKVNAFDWQEAYPEIIAAGGFDAVIGAPPPYRPFAAKAREEYFQTHYDAYAASAGLYGYFIERGLGLIRPGGILMFLIPGTFLRSRHTRPLRRLLLTRQIERIAYTGSTRVLPEGEATMCILMLRNQPAGHPFIVLPEGSGTGSRQECIAGRHDFMLDQRSLDDGGWRLDDTRCADIIEKIQSAGTFLEDYVMGVIGTGTYHIRNNPRVVELEMRDRLTNRARWARRLFTPLLRPADIRRYVPVKPSRFVIAGTNNRKIRKCRALMQYLERAGEIAGTDPGRDNLHDESGLGQENPAEHFLPEQQKQKIIFSPYQHSPAFCFDHKGSYAITSTLFVIPRNDPYLIAILNSSLGWFIIMHSCPFTDRGYHISRAAIGKFPVMVPDFEKLAERKRHDKIVAFVSQMISLCEYLPQTKTDQERRLVQQEIDATDVRIDALVYELYGLTPEEIAVVETRSA